ncbi:hypothetical protein B0H13DRAFT_2276805 [Mycena leptocephala]|nr:hypothetical protein B0H13DRAFT_2276805 [Mycena leptocephala]
MDAAKREGEAGKKKKQKQISVEIKNRSNERHEAQAEGKGPGAGVRCTDELASLPLLVDGRSKRWCSWSSVRVLEGVVNALSASGAAPDEVEGAKETGIGVADRLGHGRRPEKDRRAKANAGGDATPTWSYFSLAPSTAAVSAVAAGRCGRINDLNNEKQGNGMRAMGKEGESKDEMTGESTNIINTGISPAVLAPSPQSACRMRVLEERALQIESYAYTGGHVAAMVETVVQTADLGDCRYVNAGWSKQVKSIQRFGNMLTGPEKRHCGSVTGETSISFDDGVRVDRGFRLIWLSVVSVVLFSS